MNHLFHRQGRVSRKSFIFIYLFGHLTIIFIFISMGYIYKSKNEFLIYIVFGILIFSVILFSIILKNAIIKRLHDLGYHDRHYKTFYMPFARDLLFARLFFEKGQMQDNEYGPTTWTKKEIDKVKPTDLKHKLNNLAVKKFKTHKHQKNQKKKRTI
jgi:uncharacterized membrane protein YhaH (DUF805 family)